MTKLVEAFVKESKENPQMTVDEFYDKYGVAKKLRTNFGTAALIKQAEELESGGIGV